MKRIKKYVFVTGMVMLVSLVQPIKGTAQVVDPGCDPLDPTCPIDGQLSLLIVAAVGIAAKKSYDSKRKTVKL